MANLLKIKELMKERKLSIKELTQAVGITEQGFQNLIRQNSTRVETLESIAKCLGVPISVFFDEIPSVHLKNDMRHSEISDSTFGTGSVTYNDVAAFLEMQKGMQLPCNKKEAHMDRVFADLEQAVLAKDEQLRNKDAQIAALQETIKNLQAQMGMLIEKCLTKN